VLIIEIFQRLHGLLEALWPGSYHTDGPPFSERSDMMLTVVFQYFSTITLTTVGFGDIVPVTPAARLATGLEAIVGQLYLAVVIATLVGRVAARRQ
jgi:voltage-gated potassium channel Kch